MNRVFKALGALALAGGLLACASTPLRTLAALRSFDPLTAAPAGIRVAVRLPQGMRPQIGSMALTGTLNAHAGSPAEVRRFAVVAAPDSQLPSWMRRAGAPLYALRIAPDDIAGFEAFQSAARQAKQNGRSGSLGFDAAVCRLAERLPDTLPVSAFIKPDESSEFLPLLEDVDLLAHLPPNQTRDQAGTQTDRTIPLC